MRGKDHFFFIPKHPVPDMEDAFRWMSVQKKKNLFMTQFHESTKPLILTSGPVSQL